MRFIREVLVMGLDFVVGWFVGMEVDMDFENLLVSMKVGMRNWGMQIQVDSLDSSLRTEDYTSLDSSFSLA